MDANTIRTANGHEWTRIIRQKKLQMDQAAGELQIYADGDATWSARLFYLSLFTYHLSPSFLCAFAGLRENTWLWKMCCGVTRSGFPRAY
jgi:hypothetical protein